jgi:hypothetical protein
MRVWAKDAHTTAHVSKCQHCLLAQQSTMNSATWLQLQELGILISELKMARRLLHPDVGKTALILNFTKDAFPVAVAVSQGIRLQYGLLLKLLGCQIAANKFLEHTL